MFKSNKLEEKRTWELCVQKSQSLSKMLKFDQNIKFLEFAWFSRQFWFWVYMTWSNPQCIWIIRALGLRGRSLFTGVAPYGLGSLFLPMSRAACPKFGQPTLSSEIYNYALRICSCCRHAMMNKKSLLKSWNNLRNYSPFTISAK